MTRLLLLLGLTALAATTPAGAQAPSQGQSRAALKAQIRAAGFRVLIGMRPDSLSHGMLPSGQSALNDNAAEAIARNLERKGLQRLGRITMVPVVYGTVAEADLDRVMDDPNVEYVEPDNFSPLAVHSGPTFRFTESTPWGIPRVTAPDAWALGGSAAYGAGVKVAYLDSGGDWNHPDLLFAGGYSIVQGSSSPSAWLDNIASCKGHGTHIAGTIAGRRNTEGVVGVAPEAELYAIKVFQDVGGVCGSYTSSEIAGVDWASKNGIRVLSISIGGTSASTSYQSMISSASSKGLYVVAAAGNNGSSTMTYPGNYQDVLSVAALTSSNTKSSYSNYGANLYISAPGDNIYSTMPGGYGTKSGTSMATPHVAGVVTLVLARYPGISRAQLLARLQQGALDLGTAGRDNLTGWGLARAREAMDAAVSQPLALVVTPLSRRDTVASGATSADSDSAEVSLTGDNSATTAWSASAKHAWTLISGGGSGSGSGVVRWTRNPTGLAAGAHVDTITVVAGSLTARVIDSLVVLPPPVGDTPLTQSVTPPSRYRSSKQGTSPPADSAQVVLTGVGSPLAAWTATSLKPWTTLTVAAGVGSGNVRWSHDLTGLAAGTYVDTISVTVPNAIGSPSWVIDTLIVTALKGKRVGKTNSAGTSVNDGAALRLDSVYVDVAPGTVWEAGTSAPWVLLVSGSGSGPAWLRWQRNLAVVSYGISEDSIVVTSGSGEHREVELVVTETVVSGADQVPALTAASALFGTADLTALQRQMLDLLGNANGRYDAGDLLAYLDRTGYLLSAPMLARVMRLP